MFNTRYQGTHLARVDVINLHGHNHLVYYPENRDQLIIKQMAIAGREIQKKQWLNDRRLKSPIKKIAKYDAGVVDHSKAFYTTFYYENLVGEITTVENRPNWQLGKYDPISGMLITRNSMIDTWSKIDMSYWGFPLKESYESSVRKNNDYFTAFDGETLIILPMNADANTFLSGYENRDIQLTPYQSYNSISMMISKGGIMNESPESRKNKIAAAYKSQTCPNFIFYDDELDDVQAESYLVDCDTYRESR